MSLPSWMIGGGLSASFATLTSARDKIDPLSLTAAQLYQPASRKDKTVPKKEKSNLENCPWLRLYVFSLAFPLKMLCFSVSR